MKNIIYSSIVAAIFLVILSGCVKSENYDLKDLKTNFTVNYPIDNLREAIEVLKNKEGESWIQSLEEVESTINRKIKWALVGEKDSKNNWSIAIKTKGVLPSFSCEYLLDKDGNPVNEKYSTKECSWNK